jgi:hypothetical protein
MIFLRGLGIVCAAGAALLLTPSADAALILNLNGVINVTDNGAGDSDAAVGRITNSSNVAGFGIVVSIAGSNSPGAPTGGLLQISSLAIQNTGGAGAVVITVSDTDFSQPGSAGPMLLESDIAGTFSAGALVGDSVIFQSFADPLNTGAAGPATTLPIISTRSAPGTTEVFSGSDDAAWARLAGPYSLTNVTTVLLSPGGQVNLSGTTTAVPEPASVAVLGVAGVMGLCARRRRVA